MEIASLPYQAVVHSTETSPWSRMSKIGRAPTLQNEYKHGRWDPSAFDGSSPSADPRKKANNERVMKWKEIIFLYLSVITHDVIGQFCRPHSTVWPATLVSFLWPCP